jgi:hypothetical protein
MKQRKLFPGVATIILTVFPTTAWASTAAPQPTRPIAITPNRCQEGTISGLTAKGKMAVRSSPSAKAKVLDRLPNDMFVFACEGATYRGEKWVGIVYSRVGHGEECGPGIDSPIDSPSTGKKYLYEEGVGPCWSGWVSPKYLAIGDK